MGKGEGSSHTPRTNRQDSVTRWFYGGLDSLAPRFQPRSNAADATAAKLTARNCNPPALPVSLLSLPVPILGPQANGTNSCMVSTTFSDPYTGIPQLSSPVLAHLPYIRSGPPSLVPSNLEYWDADYVYTLAFDGDYFIARQLV